jgi:hypothetical protein
VPKTASTVEEQRQTENDKSKEQSRTGEKSKADTATVADALLKQYLRRPRK